LERATNATKVTPVEVTTDKAPVYPVMLEELLPAAWHRTDRYANNRVEADHGRLKARLRPMRGLKQDRSTSVIVAGHAFIQNVRRGHYELAVEHHTSQRVAVAFDELAFAIWSRTNVVHSASPGRRNATAPSWVIAAISIVATLRWLWRVQHPRRWQYLPLALGLALPVGLLFVNGARVLYV
jgi:hypothetical protein